MAFVNYKNTNNASSLLISDITASATTILITDGDQNLFPSNFPFLLTLEHLDTNGNVILREIVKVVGKNQNTFTVERSAGTCVQDDTATNRAQDNTAHAFYSGDRVSLYWTAEQVQDIQNNLKLKANQDAIANVYDSSLTYTIGDIVVYQGDRYQNTTAVSTPEEFDPTKWTKVNVQYDLNEKQTEINGLDLRVSALENGAGGNFVDVLVVGGGGGGGGVGSCPNGWGGGGGGGGVYMINKLQIKDCEFCICIGIGGTGGSNGAGGDGGSSSFGTLVQAGGGGGGGGGMTTNTRGHDGINGGSGGGAGVWANSSSCGAGKGLNGGNFGGAGLFCYGGGGGGAGASGGIGNTGMLSNEHYTIGANIGLNNCFNQLTISGGEGRVVNFRGITETFGAGGGGSAPLGNNANFVGGGGGAGSYTSTGGSGTNNSGAGGGGGGCAHAGGNGGSGIVIVRYLSDCSYGIKTATGGTITTCTIDGLSYKIHTFTSNGTFQITETA